MKANVKDWEFWDSKYKELAGNTPNKRMSWINKQFDKAKDEKINGWIREEKQLNNLFKKIDRL